MKNRSIYLFVGISALFCCGLGLFVISGSRNEAIVKIYKVVPVLNRTAAPETGPRQVAGDTVANSKNPTPKLTTSLKEIIDTLPSISEAEKQETMRFFEILSSQEYQAFLNAQMQEWETSYKETGVIDFSFQDFFDFFESEGLPMGDFAQNATKKFREYFPTGEPEDYEAEMAARFQEAYWATPGTRTEAQTAAFLTLSEEPDFSAWMFGRFEGELGHQLQWLDEQTAIATALEIPPTTNVERQAAMPFAPNSDTLIPTSSTETVHTPINESPQPNAETQMPMDVPTSLSTERISSIREALQQYGTDEGLLHLIESDPESVGWLLENFDSSDEINAWMSEKTTRTPPRTTQKTQTSIPSTPPIQEPPSWNGIPE